MSDNKAKGTLNDVYSIFIKCLNNVGCGLTMFLMVIIMADVCGRTIFNSPITGVAELVVALITIIAFTQLTYVQMIDKHMKVDIFFDKFPLRAKKIIKLFNLILGIIIFCFMIISTYGDLLYSIDTKEMEGEGALVLPMWPVRGTIFVCCCFVLIIMARQLYWLIRGKTVLGEGSDCHNV